MASFLPAACVFPDDALAAASEEYTEPEYSEEDWIVAAQKWAAEALKLPAEELSEWMIAVDTGLAGYTDLIAETKDMEIELILNKWDAGGYAAFLFRK